MSEYGEIRKIIEDKLTGIHESIQSQEKLNAAQHQEIISQLESVQKKQDETNGQLQQVKKETKVFRFLESKPLLLLGIIFGIAVAANHINFEKCLDMLYKLLI